MDFENLDASKNYELVIEERFDPQKVKILRSMGATKRADIEEDDDRTRALTIAQSFQAWPAIKSAIMDERDGRARTKILIEDCVPFADFDVIDPPWEETDECDGRVFVAFMQFVREAHFDDDTPYFRDIVVVPFDLIDTNSRTSREYYVFGVSRKVNYETSITMDREWFLLSHFGVEGVLPVHELSRRAVQRELAAHNRAIQANAAEQVATAKRQGKAEKAIVKYQNRNRIVKVRGGIGGGVAALAAGGIVILGLVTLWYLWAALAVVSIVSGARIWYLHDMAHRRAAALAHPELVGKSDIVIESARQRGYYETGDCYYDDDGDYYARKRVYVELDPRLQ